MLLLHDNATTLRELTCLILWRIYCTFKKSLFKKFQLEKDGGLYPAPGLYILNKIKETSHTFSHKFQLNNSIFSSFSYFSDYFQTLLHEPRYNKTNKVCVPSEDSDQPGHPPSLTRVFAVRSVGS